MIFLLKVNKIIKVIIIIINMKIQDVLILKIVKYILNNIKINKIIIIINMEEIVKQKV